MRAAAGQLRLRFDEIVREHRGEAGRQREDDVREFLSRFLPHRLGIASGEIVASNGDTSPQLDIIIYDALETPLFDESNGSIVVPIEGVYGVVEVASKLDAAKLRADADKIRRVKTMMKSEAAYLGLNIGVSYTYNFYGRSTKLFPILGFCFGYTSSSLPGLQEALLDLDAETAKQGRVDMVASLSHGCIANGVPITTPEGEEIFTHWASTPDPESQRFCVPIDPEDQPGQALMLFYLLIATPLVQARTQPLNLTPYMEIRG
jgi:uncharacterized protein DUF6602